MSGGNVDTEQLMHALIILKELVLTLLIVWTKFACDGGARGMLPW